MSEETKEQKRCESCGQLYPEQRDDFIHYDPDQRGIVCRASFNGLRLTTELAGVTCPKCRLIAAGHALLKACKAAWDDVTGKSPSSYLKFETLDKLKAAIELAELEKGA